MSASCLRHTVLPGTSRLFADFVYRFDNVARFYRHDPWNAESYLDAARAIEFPPERRAALVDALRQFNGDHPLLAELAKPGAVAVVTGQQVGLFTGPCYTVYKALTAIRLAERIRSQGVPAVPVFWLATEDHDFDEIAHAWNFDNAQRPQKHRVAKPVLGTPPAGVIPIPAFPLGEFRQSLEGFPFAEEVFALVSEAYRDGATMGGAFVSALRRLLPVDDLLYIDPMRPEIRALGAPLMRQAVERAPELMEQLTGRNAELEAAGYHAQVHVEPKTSLFFLLKDGERIALKREGAAYSGKSTAELAMHAGELSPNALLRPVIQDFMLPTAALIGGPAEVAYLAQTEVLYRVLDRPMPVVVPRAGFTLVDARAAKLMSRYGLAVPDFFHGPEPVRERISTHLVPVDLRAKLNAVHASTETALAEVRGKVTEFDPTLAKALDKSRTKILYQLSKIEAKTAREALRRDTRAEAEAAYLTGLLFPEKHLQERLYTILPFLARHGFGLIDAIRENVRLECPDHVVLAI
ncbi:MAG: bacillithiol biosynthesis cysteine-adding enzyme BshC [Bryobacteraceae bacterium]